MEINFDRKKKPKENEICIKKLKKKWSQTNRLKNRRVKLKNICNFIDYPYI